MILATLQDEQRIFDYIGKDFGRCAYLYIDLKKYGFDNENVHLWYQEKSGEIQAILLQYYNGMHLYSRTGNYDPEDMAEVVREQKPAMVCGMKETIGKLQPFFPSKKIELGKVVQLNKYTGIHDEKATRATREELGEIVDLLMTDEVMGGPYTRDLLYKQFLERYDTGFGRSYIRRNEEGILFAHSGTYAELSDIAVISGGIVDPKYRCHGEYARLLGSVCGSLVEEGKTVISYYYKVAAWSHKQVGFEELGDWAKLEM